MPNNTESLDYHGEDYRQVTEPMGLEFALQSNVRSTWQWYSNSDIRMVSYSTVRAMSVTYKFGRDIHRRVILSRFEASTPRTRLWGAHPM